MLFRSASHHGDWKAAQELIRRRAKELGVDVTTLPGFAEEKSSGQPYELLASAADDVKSATAPEYDPTAAAHDDPAADCMTCRGNKMLPHPVTGVLDMTCPGCNGTGAVVTVDEVNGIPGDEQPLSAGRRLELRLRLQEMDEMALVRA